MSRWELDQAGMHLELAPNVHLTIYDLPGDLWGWQIAALKYAEPDLKVVVLDESQEDYGSEQAAEMAGLEAALALAKRIEETALGKLRRNKQAAQDADDAALVATAGEIVWAVRDAGFATLHTATVAGHRCCVEVYTSGGVKWELEPEHYGHPLTWYAPDLETAKMRAAAAALREPCKLWRVTLPAQRQAWRRIEGGEVEVWAVTREGALYRAAQALGVGFVGCGSIEGEAVEVAG